MGALAIPLIIAGTTISAAGAIQAGRVAEAEGKSRQNIAEYNALVQEREAEAIRQQAGFESKRQAKRAARVKSTLTAELGAAGGLGSLVAGDLAAEQAAELELENLLIGFGGEVAAGRAETQAELDRLQGKLYRRRGKAEKAASYYRAGGTLLTGFGTAYA